MNTILMTPSDRQLIEEIAVQTKTELERHYMPGFGVFPSADSDDNYYNQLWCRDFAHAAGNYFIREHPEAVLDSLKTIFQYQRPNGGLPFRVEREYTTMKIIPGFDRIGARVFKLFEGGIRRRKEKPMYESGDTFDAGDTIPVILITIGGFYTHQEMGKVFVREHLDQIKKAISYLREKSDPTDGFAIIKGRYPDWADSVRKTGKLGSINIWWAEALDLMAVVFRDLGFVEDANAYSKQSELLRTNLYLKLYDAEGAYFKTTIASTRLSTVASIFGSLYIVDATQAARVEDTLDKRVKHASGYKNFDPSYPLARVLRVQRILGNGGYHNAFVWPWVTLQNIIVKAKIAMNHPDVIVRERYKAEAVADLQTVAKLFKSSGGAYEIFLPDEPTPAKGYIYKSARNFMGSLAGFQGAYYKLKSLGWLD